MFKAFHAHVGFLRWALRAVGDVDFAALKLPAPSNAHMVDVGESKRPGAREDRGAADNPSAKPRLISAGKASALDPLQRARLRQQFAKLDYLP